MSRFCRMSFPRCRHMFGNGSTCVVAGGCRCLLFRLGWLTALKGWCIYLLLIKARLIKGFMFTHQYQLLRWHWLSFSLRIFVQRGSQYCESFHSLKYIDFIGCRNIVPIDTLLSAQNHSTLKIGKNINLNSFLAISIHNNFFRSFILLS